MPQGLAEDAPIRSVEFIDPSDPEWKGFPVTEVEFFEDQPVLDDLGAPVDPPETKEVLLGTLRTDDENDNCTLIVKGGSINLLAEQRAPLKSALASLAKSFPTGKAVDLGHVTVAKVGHIIDPNTDEAVPRIIVRGIGQLTLTPEQATIVAEVL